jgi:competence ComEA-like helix-hairpin-helix protein
LVAGAIVALLAAPSLSRAVWDKLENCRYLVKRFNDGDSFHISVAGTEYIFRLYFVDAPETGTEFRDRIEEQAKYFGLTVEQTLQVAELAKRFTRERLSEGFFVRTNWQDAGGRSRKQRFYAVVQTNNGDLGEQLAENGLARVHRAAGPEENSVTKAEWQELTRLEKKAKQEKIGAWGVMEGRVMERAQDPESEQGIDPFRPFDPDNIPNEKGTATRSPSPGDKLDVNTASQAELENISGIGPVLAERIIAARPFKTADELRNVKGIGYAKFARIRPFFQ